MPEGERLKTSEVKTLQNDLKRKTGKAAAARLSVHPWSEQLSRVWTQRASKL
jgi:hypothetical protein